jgi:N-acetylmuramoyl-L-alanine amidase
MNYSWTDLDVAARTAHGEARDQGYDGLIAVLWVIRNRAWLAAAYMAHYKMKEHPIFGDGSIRDVCQQAGQFDCWRGGDSNLAVIQKVTQSDAGFRLAIAAAAWVFTDNATDPTQGATHYYNPKIAATPAWSIGRKPNYIYRDHQFFNSVVDQLGVEHKIQQGAKP